MGYFLLCSQFFPNVRVFYALQRTLNLKKRKDRVREPSLKSFLAEIKREREKIILCL